MLSEELEKRLRAIRNEAEEKVIVLGRECAALLSGFDSDGDSITNVEAALSTILAAVKTERYVLRVLAEGGKVPDEHSSD